MSDDWSPFDKDGCFRLTFYTDPWWKRLLARLRGEPLWHRMGAFRDDSGDEILGGGYDPHS